MTSSLTYADALKVLGFHKSRLLGFLDAAATVGLGVMAGHATASGQDIAVSLGLYEVKNDIINLAHKVFSKVESWRSTTSRFDRSERLAAAHAILVIASFYESLDALVDLQQLQLNRYQMAIQATGGEPPAGYEALINLLIERRLPLPEPHRPYAEVREEIIKLHELMGRNLAVYLRGTAVWDELSETRQETLLDDIEQAAIAATRNYDKGFQRLAADNREFEIWANLTEVHAIGTGLMALTGLFNEMLVRSPGSRPKAHLVASYRAALEEAITASGEIPEGIVLPQLEEAYIDPYFRVSEVLRGDFPASDSWWEEKSTHTDMQMYLGGYLTSPRATRAPLVVLGEPGSGKSKLTEILAARLSHTEDYLPIRVALRSVPAESMIQTQIEAAIAYDTGERVSWHDLLTAAPGCLPVVILDGFDELLQNADITRYDYLEQVAEFQNRQMSIGHPVTVIVTSRTVLADRVRFPSESLALRLLPFDDDQVRSWLAVWRRCNAAPLEARGLVPLTPDTALAHRDLAAQPLLLLMLAIYDATDNALERGSELNRAGLYEKLFMEFALREVRKSEAGRRMSEEDQYRAAIRELWRQAVAALAMFVRGRQSISDLLLGKDLEILFTERIRTGPMQEGLTASQKTTGRFFFVHKTEAHRGEQVARSYEFLHATFGEFLMAWLTVHAICDLSKFYGGEDLASTVSIARINDGYLFAVLSFRCLAERASVVEFMSDLLGDLTRDQQSRCRKLIRSLIHESLYPHDQRSHLDYQPVVLPATARLAAYSANLFIILAQLANDIIDLGAILEGEDPERIWFSYIHLWKGNLTKDEWAGLSGELGLGLFRLYKEGAAISFLLEAHPG